MKIANHRLEVATRGQGFIEITDTVASWAAEQGIDAGLLHLFIEHTSASLIIQENADRDVLRDMETFFDQLVPEGGTGPGRTEYRHAMEGSDDMPAHIRSALTLTSLSIPIVRSRLGLGTWQGIFVFEHRSRPHTRKLTLTVIGQ